MAQSPPIGVVNFQQPAESGGTYVGLSLDVVRWKHRMGFEAETAWRYHKGIYDGYETYRPIFTDFNALYQPKVTKKVGLDFIGGIGVATLRFNLPGPCNVGGCIDYNSSNHFMEDLGFGVRYRAWRRIFVRPEVHYYHIQNNQEFHSDNVFRVGASVGYSFGK